MSSLSRLLLHQDHNAWVREMTKRDLDFKNPVGYDAFLCFKQICIQERNTNEVSRADKGGSPPKSKNKSRSTHKVQAIDESSSDDDVPASSHNTNFHNKQWYPAHLKFPCPLRNHKHEMSTCAEFFSLNPTERWDKMDKGKLCYCCLRPKNICTPKKCPNEDSVPATLKCDECKTWAQTKGLAPFNILFCRQKDHSASRAAFTILKKDMEKYIGKFGSTIVDSSIKFSVNYMYQIHSLAPGSANGVGWGQSLNNLEPAPVIDTETGCRIRASDVTVIPEIQEHACYLMQTIRIGEAVVLVFFDRGANIHIIDGALATQQNLQLISSKPTALTVVGGKKIKTDYGTFRFNLGPGEDNQYHEIVCAGMDSVTAGFGKYDLSEICQEYRDNAKPEEKNVILPPSVGGTQVQLLLGIKNTHLDPVLLKVLPSGVGVYLSPFKDVWGSRIIFAGPHHAFTQGNQGVRDEVSHAVFLLRDRFEDALLREEESRPYSLLTDKALGTTIHPYPFSEKDLLDAGGEVPEQFETKVECNLDQLMIMHEPDHYCGVHVAKVPISRMRMLIDQDDIEDTISFRCPACSRCTECKKSPRTTAVSLQEAREQEFIEKSVRINLEENIVVVTYPFLKDPVEFLTARHHHTDNYNQALKVYKGQCRKSDRVKEGMREVHKDLVEKGFMKKLSDLDEDTQDSIRTAGFRHYNPWRLIMKTDSLTTPVRMVVDPTQTLFNLLLAKGENRMGFIFNIIINCRSREYAWSSDISKLYNQLRMHPSGYPYSLFLYHESLDAATDPLIWVMVRAWYGISSTGGQAGYAIEKLMNLFKDEYPKAEKPLKDNRYVDDLLSGADTEEDREREIESVQKVLGKGGFALKFVVRSGDKPSEKASSDGESMKMLGYRWDTEKDILSPGIGELNMNKKKRGEKKANEFPIVSEEDADLLLKDVKLTRRMILAKISEMFDPCGFWEPIKVQMKLELKKIQDFEWDVEIPENQQVEWKEILREYVHLHEIMIPRFCIPSLRVADPEIRLICLSDAAELCGGAAIYAGRRYFDGSWSCSLLASKSKMMDATIPRNELSAILLCTELAFLVKKALGDRVGEIIYVTDSTIALSWCNNTNIKLRLFVYNRVMTILRMCEWTTGAKEIPLYHIESDLNLADLLTKKHPLQYKDVSAGSKWIEGMSWMKLDTKDMPLLAYDQLRVEKPIEDEVRAECFGDSHITGFEDTTEKAGIIGGNTKEILSDDKDFLDHNQLRIARSNEAEVDLEAGVLHLSDFDPGQNSVVTANNVTSLGSIISSDDFSPSVFALSAARGSAELIVDPVFLGWRRTLRTISYLKAVHKILKHRKHLILDSSCEICEKGKDKWKPNEDETGAEDVLFRYETTVIKNTVKMSVLEKFLEKEGIIYADGRLSAEFQFRTEDLDNVKFIDKHEIIDEIPVVLCDSPVLYSYAMYIHTSVSPHSGVEATMKEIHKKMRVLSGLRSLIKKINQDCLKCRLREKRTAEMRMSSHPIPRTVLAPPFHSAMMDIAYGFKGQAYKRARSIIKIYALVIVCMLSGATNILALEGIQTQDIIGAIERHSSRYGIPAFLYIDCGTQLKALQHASFSIRDMEAQIQDSLGIKIIVSNAKAHTERGRVERRIRTLRESLDKMGINTNSPMTCIQWECLFAKISNAIGNLPIARGDTSNETNLGFEIITPNRLLMGRNNYRSLEGAGITLDMSYNLTSLLDRNREIYKNWFEIFISNIHLLDLRPNKWLKSSRSPVKDDIVLFIYNDSGCSKNEITWKLGKVIAVTRRKVSIAYSNKGSNAKCTMVRSVRDISIIYSVGELMINTQAHFKACGIPAKADE